VADLSDKSISDLWEDLGRSEGLEKAHILDHLHRLSMIEGEYQDALAFAEQASMTYTELEALPGLIYARVAMANAHKKIGSLDEAMKIYRDCCEDAESVLDDEELATIWEYLGDSCNENSRPLLAIEAFVQAEALNITANAPVDSARCAQKLGDVQGYLGLSDDAVSSYLRGCDYLIGKNELSAIGTLQDRISDVYFEMGKSDEAIDFAKKSLHIALTCDCKLCLPQAHFRLGSALTGAGEFDSARLELNTAETLFTNMRSPSGQAKVWLAIARLNFAEGKPGVSELAERAQTIFEALDWQQFVCEAKILKAQTMVHAGDISGARDLLIQVEQEAVSEGAIALADVVRKQLANC
jgi:tetratricopeptide (TPR) repeat protein